MERFGPRELVRTAAVAGTLGGAVGRRMGLRFGRSPRDAMDARARARVTADGVVDGFQALGPMFVKLGQLIGSSPGVFPSPLADACLRCLDDLQPFSAAEARAVIEADLGQPMSAMFRDFEDEPLSAASVAQVHACVLADGREAVMKVQRPGIARRMIVDLRVAWKLATLLERRYESARIANAVGVAHDLYRSTITELDFRAEADNQARIRENLSTFGDNDGVVIPEVYPRYCGTRTICMQRVHGVPLDRFDTVRSTHPNPELLIRRLVKAWMESVMVHGLFHGDVHAGNLWLLHDGRLAILDFGIVGTMPRAWRALLQAMFHASAIDGDYTPVARALRELELFEDHNADDAAIGAQLAIVLGPLLSGELAHLDLGTLTGQLVEFGRRRGMIGPQPLILMGKQLSYFERYAVALAPRWRLGSDLYLFRNIFPAAVTAAAARAGTDLPD